MSNMKNNKRIFSILTMLAILFAGIVSLEGTHSAPNAAFEACQGMGRNMDSKSGIIGDMKNSVGGSRRLYEEPNKKWTVHELFQNSTRFTTYYGEGEKTWLYSEKVDRGKSTVGDDMWNAEGVQDKLNGARTFRNCYVSTDGIGDGFSGMASGIVSITKLSMSFLLGDDFMVDTITEIVGGKDGEGGLIETFYNSIYMPLIVIAVIFLAVSVIYKGLIQMKFREALNAIIWSSLSFIVGVALMLNPGMLAGAPQKATTLIAECTIGAMNGENCMTGDVSTPSLLAGKECISAASGDSGNADAMINSMSCTMWKSLVLDQWAETQFGAPYKDLYTMNAPAGGSIWSALPEGMESKYCVNLASTKSAKDSIGYVELDYSNEATVCNVALYQLYIKTSLHDPINQSGDNKDKLFSYTNDYDERWYNIIVPMAMDESNWNTWSGFSGQSFNRIGSGFMSFVAAAGASIVLFTLSILGSSYKITSVVMMAFAPIFLLFAVEPNRGRKLFLGWLETLVSSILKYFAVTILVIVSLTLYAGVLSNTSGMTSFISVIILTFALNMYRGEIINIIGASNLGGQRLSNKFNEKLEAGTKQAKRLGSAYVGGRVGGAVGALKNKNENIESREGTIQYLQDQLASAEQSDDQEMAEEIKRELSEEEEALDEYKKNDLVKEGSRAGGSSSLDRVLKRGTSATATAFSQKDRTQESLKAQDELAAKAEKETRANEEIQSQSKEDNSNDSGNDSGKGEHEITLDSQRDKVPYTGNLSGQEVHSLDAFAKKISEAKVSDEDLISEGRSGIHGESKEEYDNKKKLVANEINSRIKHNTLNNIPSGRLGRSEFANLENLSPEELKLNSEILGDQYLQTGDGEQLNKLQDISEERKRRIDISDIPEIDKETSKKEIDSISEGYVDKRDELRKANKHHENPISIVDVNENPDKYLKDGITIPSELREKNADALKARDKAKERKNDSGNDDNSNNNNRGTPNPNDNKRKNDSGDSNERKEESGNDRGAPNPNENKRRNDSGDSNERKEESGNDRGAPNPNENKRRNDSGDSNERKEESGNDRGAPNPNENKRRNDSGNSNERKEESGNDRGAPNPNENKRRNDSGNSNERKEESGNDRGAPNPNENKRRNDSGDSNERKEEPGNKRGVPDPSDSQSGENFRDIIDPKENNRRGSEHRNTEEDGYNDENAREIADPFREGGNTGMPPIDEIIDEE